MERQSARAGGIRRTAPALSIGDTLIFNVRFVYVFYLFLKVLVIYLEPMVFLVSGC